MRPHSFPLLALMLASLACQSLAPDTQPTLPSGDVFVDDFSDPASGWATGSDSDGSLDYESGQYVFRVTTGQFFTWGNLARKQFDNLRLEVEVENKSATTEPTFGALCHYQDADNYYSAGFGSDGFYAIVRTEAGVDTFLTSDRPEWVPSEDINQNASRYSLAVECANGHLMLEVDGKLIASVEDTTFTSGRVGLFVLTFDHPEAHVRFDNLRISEVK